MDTKLLELLKQLLNQYTTNQEMVENARNRNVKFFVDLCDDELDAKFDEYLKRLRQRHS